MAYESKGLRFSFTANSDMTNKQFTAVELVDDFTIDTATADTNVLGIVDTNPRAGLAGTVVINGITKVKVADGATVTAGKGVTFTNGEASGDGDYGVILETVTGPGLTSILLGVQKVAAAGA